MSFNDKINEIIKDKSLKKFNLSFLLTFFVAVLFLSSCSDGVNNNLEVKNITEKTMTKVTIKTSVGDIQLELNDEKAPITVENFKTIDNCGY